MKELNLDNISIEGKIHTIRGVQIILDYDLAELYQVETKSLNQAVKRNVERFPTRYMFKLTNDEFKNLRSQFVTANANISKKRFEPYAFTEQGIAMLSSVLRSKIAINVNIKIIDAFVSMRKIMYNDLEMFSIMNNIERKLLKYDTKFEQIFDYMSLNKPKQGIFFNGQVFDAHKFILDLIKSSKSEIILIDNYIDEIVLELFSNTDIDVIIYTNHISRKLQISLDKYNSQYRPIKIKKFSKSHDRFIIIDKKEIYHIGASLKDLGKKWFAFSKLNIKSTNMLEKLR